MDTLQHSSKNYGIVRQTICQLSINFKIEDLICQMLISQATLFNFSLSETILMLLVPAVYRVCTKSFQGFGNGLGLY